MHYYKRNIGDYAKKAGRLTMLQHGAYTLLMDAIYDRETFPTKEEAVEWCWASNADEVAAVEFILARFFVQQDGVYVQKRIQEELDKFQERSATNREIAIARETKRREGSTKRVIDSTKRTRSDHESPPNHKPLTTNQEPKEKKRARFTPPSISDVREYVTEKSYQVDPEDFVNFYTSKGWVVGKSPMKDWKAAIRIWQKKAGGQRNQQSEYGKGAI